MNSNPLLFPEILSKVLDYVDLSTLKASRLINSFWNKEAGKLLSSSYWVKPYNYEDNPLDGLQHTLGTSPDPGLCFGKFKLYDYSFPREYVFNFFQTYGTFLKALDYNYLYSNNSHKENPPALCQLLIHRVLTEWCPSLQELSLTFCFLTSKEKNLIPSLEFRGPTNLRNLKLEIDAEIPEGFQDYLVQIVAASSKMKVLRISRNAPKVNDRLYHNLTALQHITKNLEKLAWKENDSGDNPKIVPNTQFLTNQLKTLRIKSANVDPKRFPVMINTIGSSLKNLELFECGFNRDTLEEFQSHLFKMVIKTLVNLETLKIGYPDCSPDYFFSNADTLNAPPHKNLRRLFFPWCCEANLLDVSSVSAVVKWFPNLTILSLCFGYYEFDESWCTMGQGIRLQEAVRILSGLKKLKDLNLRLCSNTAPGDLQLALKALKQFPSLLCCTFVEINSLELEKTTYAPEDLQDELKELKHLSIIRLLGFKINGKKALQNFAKDNGIKLEFSNFTKGFSIDEQLWSMKYSLIPHDDE